MNTKSMKYIIIALLIVILILLGYIIISNSGGCILGHKWEDANCFHPKRCTVCGKTDGEALSPTGAHKWEEATCEHGSTCIYCGEVRTDPLPHNYGDDGICHMCGNSKNGTIGNVIESDSDKKISTSESSSISEKEILEREDADFRNAKWGDSKETVKKYEPDLEFEDVDDHSNISATGTITEVDGYEVFLAYYFDKDKLYNGSYRFLNKYTSGGQDIVRYNSLKETMIKIYGEPEQDRIVPHENQSLIDHAGKSKALEYGYVTYITFWNTSTTEIILAMKAENFEIDTQISYTDINYEEDPKDSGL